jgi:hypothetical protein
MSTVAEHTKTARAAKQTPQPKTQSEIFSSLADLFDAAAHTDEAHAHSGDSDRLLNIAAHMARAAAKGNTLGTSSREDFAFDLAALVRGARLIPGDTESPERSAILSQAGLILKQIAGASEDPIAPLAQRPALEHGRQDAPAGEATARPPAVCDMTGELHWELTLAFDRAEAILNILIHLFGGDSDVDKPSSVEELGGVMMNLDHLLREANASLLLLDDLPVELCEAACQAYSLVHVLDQMLYSGDYTWRMADGVYCSYFDAARTALERANKALNTITYDQMVQKP